MSVLFRVLAKIGDLVAAYLYVCAVYSARLLDRLGRRLHGLIPRDDR